MNNADMDKYHLGNSRDWLLKSLRDHDKVSSVEIRGKFGLIVKRVYGDIINIVLSGKYVLGEFELESMLDNDTNCIVMGSARLNYTSAAKRLSRERGIGLFTVKELLGALSREHEFWLYEAKDK